MKYEIIGQKIKKARIDKKLTQEKFAEKLDVSVSFISQVENGEKKFNLERISEISQILQKPVNYFIDGYEVKTEGDLEEAINLLKNMSTVKLKLSLELIKTVNKIDL